MTRTYVITGSASGIGKATVEVLRGRGQKVIGVDLHHADINADLSTRDGRAEMVSEASRLSDGRIDGLLAVAGLSTPAPVSVAVNFFGMVATLEGLRPLLWKSDAPRAVTVSSMVSLFAVDDILVAAMADGDEDGALARAAALSSTPTGGALIYPSTKKATAQWVRRSGPADGWAGAGISLNAIAPGVVRTPMSAVTLETEEGRNAMRTTVPMPLNGHADAIAPAHLLAWLTSEENTHVCGQVIFIDGGSEAITRGDSRW